MSMAGLVALDEEDSEEKDNVDMVASGFGNTSSTIGVVQNSGGMARTTGGDVADRGRKPIDDVTIGGPFPPSIPSSFDFPEPRLGLVNLRLIETFGSSSSLIFPLPLSGDGGGGGLVGFGADLVEIHEVV